MSETTYVIRYHDGTDETVHGLIGTNILDGPNGARGWHVQAEYGHAFIAAERVLYIRDLRYPPGFDTVWDSRTGGA